ncbi:MAG TPA: CDGSH iron-sulfur domain-containing protein [Jatrophihabitantaceae bacterium]|nr:CDGSH iron-sulfur domain-containing protein [Jatrophihabitantaceae bacterium]
MDIAVELRSLAAAARALADAEPDEGVRDRLRRSVIRPLSAVAGDGAAPAEGESLRELALRATRLRVEPDIPIELIEAVAALQQLAIEAGTSADDFTAAQASLPPSIQTQPDGPYLLTNVAHISDWLGVPVPTAPQVALCRCGESALKPFCDGRHAEVGFTDGKDPERVPDRRDTYDGEQVTVLDNRGTCAHSGFCTSRLPTTFRAGEEPFVAPSGGRMDEIVRAVRACPSGALSFALGGREAREQVDQDRDPGVEVSKDGPYRVTGGIPLVDSAGAPVARNEGASFEHYSLCRCGHSQNKPFCSGMHWYVNFADPPMSDQPTLFEWAGGFPALLRMTRLFYGKYVPADPLLAPLFASMSPDHPERVAAWLGETFGGPKLHTAQYGGYDRMVGEHLGKSLREEQRARWVQLISQAANDAGLPTDPEFRAAFTSYLEWGSRIAVENSTPGADPPQHMPVPRWDWVVGARPGSRVSALRDETDEPAVALPAPGEAVGFGEHIKPLFRGTDRQSMSFAFDLWSYADVSQHADAILQRLEAGSMPCDGAWPAERVAVFRTWATTGKAE